MALLEVCCGWCRSIFLICSSCYRGQRYCGAPCRTGGRRVSVRTAQRRYAASEEAREDQAERMRAYRISLKSRVIDQGSIEEVVVVDGGEAGDRSLPAANQDEPPVARKLREETVLVASNTMETRDGKEIRVVRRPTRSGCCVCCGRSSRYVWPVGSWEDQRRGRSTTARGRARRSEVFRC